MTTDVHFYFPETIAIAGMLVKIGIPSEELFFLPALDPKLPGLFMSVQIRRRGQTFTVVGDKIPEGQEKETTFARATNDLQKWNLLDEGLRDSIVEGSRIRSRAVELLADLALRRIYP